MEGPTKGLETLEIGTLFATGAASFALTNLDNLTMLLILAPGFGWRRILAVWGVVQALVLLVAAGLAVGLAAFAGPWVGLLGFVPIGIGVYALATRLRAGGAPVTAPTPVSGALAAALTFIGLSGDTLAVMGPLLADTLPVLRIPLLAGAAAMAALMLSVAGWIGRRTETLSGLVPRVERMLPYLLIAVGLYILANTGTDAF